MNLRIVIANRSWIVKTERGAAGDMGEIVDRPLEFRSLVKSILLAKYTVK